MRKYPSDLEFPFQDSRILGEGMKLTENALFLCLIIDKGHLN